MTINWTHFTPWASLAGGILIGLSAAMLVLPPIRREASRMNALGAFAAGLIFGVGLIVSGMTDPGKIIGFLDVFGSWDPSLAFVMVGAILVGFFAFMPAHRRAVTFLGGAVHLPKRRDIDNRLVGGIVIYHAAERLLHEPSRRPG